MRRRGRHQVAGWWLSPMVVVMLKLGFRLSGTGGQAGSRGDSGAAVESGGGR
jgi:hypothetical protein